MSQFYFIVDDIPNTIILFLQDFARLVNVFKTKSTNAEE